MFLLLKAAAYNVTKQEPEPSCVCCALEAAGETVMLNIREDVWAQRCNSNMYISPVPNANCWFCLH